MKRGSAITLALVAGLIAVLVWSSLGAQKVTCHACMDFRGGHNCASAAASTKAEAARSAQNTACGTLAQGMDESIACTNTKPVTLDCAG